MSMIRRNSLRNKLILFLLASIIVPISISILITYFYTKESVKDYYIRDTTNLIRQGSMNIVNYMNQLNEASLLVYNNLSEPNSMYQLMQDGSQTYLEEREMYRNLQFMANSVKEIEQIYLYSADEDISYRYAYKLLRHSPGQTYETPSFPANRDVWVEAAHPSHEYGVAKPKFPYHIERDVISMHRIVTEAPTDEFLGFLSLDVRMDMIREISEVLYTPGNEELYLLDGNGNIIFASDPEQVNHTEKSGWIRDILKHTGDSGNSHYEDDWFEGIHVYERLPAGWLDWTLVKRIPYEVLYKDAYQLTLINSLVVSLFLIIAAVAALYISFWFTNPIKQLIRYINKIESGNLDANMEIRRTDEIGILARRFHQLIQRLNQLIMREYRLEIASKTNQLKALQAQVNPHFMNNALQSIGTLALQHGDRKTYSLISSLGKMMRYHMKTDDSSVPLSAELDYVRSYLALQKQRFDDQLSYHIEVDEQAAKIEVPKMILQPIVENYFKHGFQPVEGPGEIQIACRLTERLRAAPLLEITVEDNGIGMEETRRIQLQSMLDRHTNQLEPDKHDDDHIGLMNVMSRLRLFFVETAQMRLEEGSIAGLRVVISIPLAEGGDHVYESADRG